MRVPAASASRRAVVDTIEGLVVTSMMPTRDNRLTDAASAVSAQMVVYLWSCSNKFPGSMRPSLPLDKAGSGARKHCWRQDPGNVGPLIHEGLYVYP